MLVLVLIGTVIVLWVWSWSRRNKDEPPLLSGSKIIIGNALRYVGNSVQLWNNVKTINKEASERGGVLKTTIGPKLIYVVSDPEDVTTVANACLEKASVYTFTKSWVGVGLVSSSGSIWKAHRKLLNPSFNQYVLDSFIDIFNEQSRSFVEKLKVQVGKGPFDHSPYTQSCALQIICSTALGVDFSEKSDANIEFIETLSKMFNLIVIRFQSIFLHNNFLFNLSSLKRKQDECIKILHNMSNTILRRRKRILEKEIKKDNITDRLPTQSVDVNIVQHLMNVPLADPLWYVPGEVELLIGAQLFPFLLLGRKILSTPALSALEIVFGYIIKGDVHVSSYQKFQFNRIAFGLKSSPFLAMLSVRQLFADEKEQFSCAAMVALNEMYMDDLATSVESVTKGKDSKTKLFMDLLLELSRDTNSITDQEIREHVDTIIVAGHDTSATVLLYCILLVGSYPRVQEKVHDELKNVFGDKDRDITKQDLSQLVYLEAVIKESMRIYPIVPVIGRHLHEDIKLRNCTLLKGNSVCLFIYGVNRHSMWGPDVEEFKPERWLDPSSLPDSTYTSASFSIGRRSCIGKTYAMMSMKIIMAHFCRNYMVHGDHTKLTLQLDVMLKPVSGHHITIEKRN